MCSLPSRLPTDLCVPATVRQIPRHPDDWEKQAAEQDQVPSVPAAPGTGRSEHTQRKPQGHQARGDVWSAHALISSISSAPATSQHAPPATVTTVTGHDDIVPTVRVAADAGTALPCLSGRATLEA